MRQLRAIGRLLLDPSSSMSTLTAAVAELHDLCVAVTAFGRGDGAADLTEAALPTGRALSPRDAATCLTDPLRTAAFIRGADAAIRVQRNRHPDRPVEIVYAGTGPFAPLVLPLLERYGPAEVQVTAIDVHERSVELVERLIDRLGLADRVRAILAADATTYVHPTESPLDIVMVEAMQRSLSVEPQVAIARQLAPRLGCDGILIPERVTVRLLFAERSVAVEPWGAADCQGLLDGAVTVMELTKETARTPLDRAGRYPPAVVACPSGAESGRMPVLVTTIDVYGGHALGPYESGLTTPEPLWPLADLRAGERIAAQYKLGRSPGLVWERYAPDSI